MCSCIRGICVQNRDIILMKFFLLCIWSVLLHLFWLIFSLKSVFLAIGLGLPTFFRSIMLENLFWTLYSDACFFTCFFGIDMCFFYAAEGWSLILYPFCQALLFYRWIEFLILRGIDNQWLLIPVFFVNSVCLFPFFGVCWCGAICCLCFHGCC